MPSKTDLFQRLFFPHKNVFFRSWHSLIFKELIHEANEYMTFENELFGEYQNTQESSKSNVILSMDLEQKEKKGGKKEEK